MFALLAIVLFVQPPKDSLDLQPPAKVVPTVAAPVLVITKPKEGEVNTTLSATGAINWNTVILGFLAFLQTIIVAFIPLIVSNMTRMKKLGEATHTLANSAMGTALRDSAEAKERLAEGSKSEADIRAAITARRASDDHIAAQRLIDQGGKIVTAPADSPPGPK